ncbi:beta family protein [Aeromonas dhakensis]|uniref:beta family protein n=1 Tax=Aeromonas dhakensis TaxID=196024 RepID=UPI0029D7612C|nr:hypothetical protein [Aeromonas dhakensis]MDX7739917.1 hypothetical protein [Aeromonas dhakensis]
MTSKVVDFLNFKYCPILAISPAEMGAIEQLPGKDRDLILPLFPLKGWLSSKKMENTLGRVQKSIESRWWIADIDRTCLVDQKDEKGVYTREVFSTIADLLIRNDGYANWYNFIKNVGLAIPTLQYDEKSTIDEIKNQASKLISINRGLVIRISVKEIAPTLFNTIIRALRDFDSSDFLYILDYGDIDRSILQEVDDHIMLVKKVSAFFPDSVFSISSSSFPFSFSGAYRGEISIYERQFFNRILKELPNTNLIYSDRGSARAEKIKGGGGTPPPRIDYPLKNDWRFVRKEFDSDESLTKEELYQNAAIEVMASDYWVPELALWGTQMIELTSKGDDFGITNAARATSVRINIHMYLQLHYSDSIEDLDTDEEWVD